ncbi:MAG: DUF1631 family protein [Gammaproteobacteria bacterium]|nr:DUF1631 family protein [Gammaproteobacteria bacterium]
MLSRYRRRVIGFLEPTMEALFEQARERLFEGARETKDREKQSELFEAIQGLESIREPVQSAFLESIAEQLEHLGEPVPGANTLSSDSGTLDVAMVDTGTFEDWVAIKDIIARVEPQHVARQRELARSLSALVKMPIEDERNPVSLTGFGLTFHDAVQNLGASRPLRHALFASFEEVLVKGIATLLQDLGEILGQREDTDGGESEAATGADSENACREPAARREMRETHADTPAPASTEPREERRQAPPTEENTTSRAAAPFMDPASVTPPAVVTGNALHTARVLLSLERQIRLSDKLPVNLSEVATNPPSPSAMHAKARDEIIDALSILQRSPKFSAIDDKGPLALKERLMTTWRAAGLRVADAEGDAVEVVSNLLDAILDDPLVTDRVKGCVRRLAIPLVKVALQHGSFFNDAEHPARRLVNLIGQVEDEGGSNGAAQDVWRSNVEPLIERISHGYERDAGIFSEVLGDLETLVERQRQRFKENVQNVVRERKQQQAALAARRSSDDSSAADGDAGRSMPTEWQRWLGRVEHLQPGDVVFLQKIGGRPERMNLVWVSDDKRSFVFVDSSGAKTSTLTLQELAMHFRRGDARVLDASDLPVVDRGIYRMLNSLHARLAKKASHDGLTGMLNRKEFEVKLEEALSDAVRMGSNHVLCLMQLDKFEEIVDKCGRKAGKGLLRKLARAIEKHVRNKGVIGRLRSGRFAMLLGNCELESGRALADRQRRSMEQSRCVWHGETFPLTVSVGVIEVNGRSATAPELIKAADDAFKKARADGGNRVYTVEGEDVPRITGGTKLADMVYDSRLQLRCQRVSPIGADRSVKPNYEMLLGVKNERGEVAVPRDFIQLAERNNEMHEVDRWVIRTALEWMSKNRGKVDAAGGYAINLSGLTLGDEELLRYVLEQLTSSQVPPAKVIFEVTESAAIDTLSVAVNFIRTLKEYGCRFALDDFGAGQASFSYLKTLPIDYVKIDGSLVKDIADNAKDFAVVKSINEIGHFLGKKTVAEFVENDAVLARLRQIGVDYAQGFGIEAPFVLE